MRFLDREPRSWLSFMISWRKRRPAGGDLFSQRIENLAPDEVAAELAAGDVTLVDIREPEERAAAGAIPGAVHASRGMHQFYADPTSLYHRPEFETDRRIVL